jgi:RNA polymerase sigma factor (sigma-70 family)
MTQPDSHFVTTRWTRVVRAKGGSLDARMALSELCETYYAPVRGFIVAWTRNADKSDDLTQEFFARVLKGGAFDNAAKGRGKFRSFLLGSVKHFLSDMRDREDAAKRGGGKTHESLDGGTDTSPGIQPAANAAMAPDRSFDRNWTMTLLDLALQRLAKEMESEEKQAQFETLKPWLTGEVGNVSQADAAVSLGMSEGAVKVAVHRMRKRFRECVKKEIAQTLDDGQDVDGELKCLLEAVSA